MSVPKFGLQTAQQLEDLSHIFSLKSEDEQKKLLKEFIQRCLVKILKVSVEELEEKNFYELGMDSLMMGELRNMILGSLGNKISLDLAVILDHPTIDKLVESVLNISTSKTPTNDQWIIKQSKTKTPRMRIFCFHHAGGGPSAFSGWRNEFSDDIDLFLIQLPGRELRRSEPLLTTLEPVISGITESIRPYLDLPYLFFGHSMGALLAFEVTKKLVSINAPLPKHLILSSASPALKVSAENYDQLSDEEFVGLMNINFGGLPKALLENQELLQIFLPILRADVKLVNSVPILSEKLDVPITAIYCTEDHSHSEQSISNWASATQNTYNFVKFPGGHFEILTNPKSFIDMIKSIASV